MNLTSKRRKIAIFARCLVVVPAMLAQPYSNSTYLQAEESHKSNRNPLTNASRANASGLVSEIEKPSDAEVAKWIAALDSPSYKLRREAFLKLCDRSYPIDTWLETQGSQGPSQRASLIAWLVQLRKTDGNLSERLETLSTMQKVSQGDDTPLYRLVSNNRWDQAIEVLSLLSPEAVNSILRDQGGLGRFIELAWRFDSEWAIPKLLNFVAEKDERVAINRWWAEMGLSTQWRLDEQEDAPTQLARLEADGKWQEAVSFAKDNFDRVIYERTLIRAGDWAGWLEIYEKEEGAAGFNGRDVATQQLICHLMLGQEKEAKAVWQGIKERPAGLPMPGMLTIALAMDDQVAVEAYLKAQDPQVAFNIKLFQFGRVREAFALRGFSDFENKPELKKWVSDQVRRLFAERNEVTANRAERDPLLSFFTAVVQTGIAEAQQGIDEACQNAIAQNQSSNGSFRARDILGVLSRMNQREKAREYLEKLAIEKGYPLTVLSEHELQEQQDSIEEPCFAILYSSQLSEPFLIFEYLVKHYLESQKADLVQPADLSEAKADAVRKAIADLEDLHAGRLPAQWESSDFLRTLTLEVRKRILQLGRDDAAFCLSVAKIYLAFGEVNQAINLLQNWNYQSESVQVLSQALAKAGRLDLAAKLARQRGVMSDFEWFLETASLLEQSGQQEELQRFRTQQMASVHANPFLMVSPFFSLIPEDLAVSRPETKQMVDRWRRIAPEKQANLEAAFRYMLSKKDITESTLARRAAELDWFNRSADALRLGDSTVRFIFMSAIPVLALEAVHRKDEQAADKWIRMAHRIEPTQIQLIIDIMPWADKVFDKQITDRWFHLYFDTMMQAITDFPEDAVSLNNTAWLCALCDRNLDKAQEFAARAVAKRDDPTYLDTLAEVEFRLGNIEKALEISQKCQAREPRDDQHIQQMKRFAKALATKND